MFGFNGIFRKYPYMDFNEYNLDWLLEQMKSLETAFNDFAAANHLVYADPVTWDITTTYNPNTIVVKMPEEVAYISLKRVPAGTPITDTDYWSAVFDASNYNLLQDQINSLSLQLGTLNGYINDLEAGTSLPAFVKYPAMAYTDSYIIAFGDSNIMPNPPSGYGNFFERVCSYLQPKGHKSYGVSGACFQNNIGSYPVIQNQIAGANDYDADKVSIVFLMGGINDFHYGTYDTGAFGTAVRNTVSAINAKFPNALIVSMFDGGHQLPNGRMFLMQEAMKRNSVAVASGIRTAYVSLADLCLQSSLWYNQNHYGSTGEIAIACRLINKLFGGGIGYTPAPKRTRTTYTSSSPGLNGAYNFAVDTITTIDPETLVRRDQTRLYTMTNFNVGTDPASGIVQVPGMYNPALIEAGATYVPVSMLRSQNLSCINVASLTNVTPNQAGDGGHDEPEILIKLPYTSDETWTNYRGYLEFESIITMSDTQGGN